ARRPAGSGSCAGDVDRTGDDRRGVVAELTAVAFAPALDAAGVTGADVAVAGGDHGRRPGERDRLRGADRVAGGAGAHHTAVVAAPARRAGRADRARELVAGGDRSDAAQVRDLDRR